MNYINYNEEVDKDLVIEYANELIKEHKSFPDNTIGSIMEYDQAVHAAKITAKRLAQESAKKFYYEVIKYLDDMDEEFAIT